MEKNDRRANKSGSIGRHKNGSFYGESRVTLPNGTSKRKRVYARTVTERDAKLARLIYEHKIARKYAIVDEFEQAEMRHNSDKKEILIKHGLVAEVKTETLEEHLNQWCYNPSHLNPKTGAPITQTTRMNRQANIDRILPVLGAINLDEMDGIKEGEKHVDTLLAAMRAKGLGAHSVRQTWDTLRAALNDAVKKKKIVVNPVKKDRVESPPITPDAERNPLTKYDRALLLSEDDALKPMWMTFMYAGLRPSELIALRWANIDFNNNVIHVVEQAQRVKGDVLIYAPKWNSKRSVPIHAELKKALQKHMYELEPSLREKKDLVFPSTSGSYLHHSVIRSKFGKRLKTLQIKHHTLDNLRETFSTIMTEGNIPDTAVSAMMGHTSTATTKENYISHDMEFLQETMATVK